MTPGKSPAYEFEWSPSPATVHQSPSRVPIEFSPPLIATVVVVATAFLIVTYFRLISRHILPPIIHLLRRWRRRLRRRSSFERSTGDVESPSTDAVFESNTTNSYFLSPYGLDETVIKAIPLSIYTAKGGGGGNKKGFVDGAGRDCAVCLLEFEENDYVRTLPVCAHSFHVDCIDIWLRSHANCPLCRAGIFRQESPFIPLMAARIRPNLDDGILESILLEPLSEAAPEFDTPMAEIGVIGTSVEGSSPRRNESDHDRFHGRDFLLKRSYSFGFERNFASDRMVLEPVTTSPWRYRRGSFWSKRPSPFGSLMKHRVFSFRYYRGMKSPFFRRRSGGFFPLSESSVRFSGGGSSRRSKSLTSPIFMRTSGTTSAFSCRSSRMRCGDPEALLSPERWNQR